MLIGEFIHNVDAKGRVFIPAKYRNELGNEFVVTRRANGSIRAHTAANWNRYVNAFNEATSEADDLKRAICAGAMCLEMDSQGRIMLTEALRAHAQITDKVKIVGMLDCVEFWNPEKYELDNPPLTPKEEKQRLTDLNI